MLIVLPTHIVAWCLAVPLISSFLSPSFSYTHTELCSCLSAWGALQAVWSPAQNRMQRARWNEAFARGWSLLWSDLLLKNTLFLLLTLYSYFSFISSLLLSPRHEPTWTQASSDPVSNPQRNWTLTHAQTLQIHRQQTQIVNTPHEFNVLKELTCDVNRNTL